MTGIEIRKATEADLPAILGLYQEPGLDDPEVLDLEEARRIFTRQAQYPDYAVYVAAEGGRVIGTFALLIMDNLAHLGAPSGVVEDVVVHPDRRGQGIGRQMMEFAMQKCREAGCYKLALSSNLKRSRAHQFYDSLGFQRHGYSFVVQLRNGM